MTETREVTRTFHNVAVAGAGAVGSFFGAMLARAGHAVVLVARPAHVQAIAREGLRLEMAGRVEAVRVEASVLETMERIAAAMPAQLSSTAQDMARRKPSEIDHLNGFVVRRGRELGVSTPANQALYALVKLVEAGHARA